MPYLQCEELTPGVDLTAYCMAMRLQALEQPSILPVIDGQHWMVVYAQSYCGRRGGRLRQENIILHEESLN